MTQLCILAEFLVDSLPDTDRDKNDPLYVCGNITFLVDDMLMQVGDFPGALLLPSTLESLATGIRKVRRGDTIVEVTMFGDSPPVWFLAKKIGDIGGVSLAYRNLRTPLVSRLDLDVACESAARDFLAFMRNKGLLEQPPLHLTKLLDNVVSTWVTLRDFVAPASGAWHS